MAIKAGIGHAPTHHGTSIGGVVIGSTSSKSVKAPIRGHGSIEAIHMMGPIHGRRFKSLIRTVREAIRVVLEAVAASTGSNQVGETIDHMMVTPSIVAKQGRVVATGRSESIGEVGRGSRFHATERSGKPIQASTIGRTIVAIGSQGIESSITKGMVGGSGRSASVIATHQKAGIIATSHAQIGRGWGVGRKVLEHALRVLGDGSSTLRASGKSPGMAKSPMG